MRVVDAIAEYVHQCLGLDGSQVVDAQEYQDSLFYYSKDSSVRLEAMIVDELVRFTLSDRMRGICFAEDSLNRNNIDWWMERCSSTYKINPVHLGHPDSLEQIVAIIGRIITPLHKS
jgi:hypothetical protein